MDRAPARSRSATASAGRWSGSWPASSAVRSSRASDPDCVRCRRRTRPLVGGERAVGGEPVERGGRAGGVDQLGFGGEPLDGGLHGPGVLVGSACSAGWRRQRGVRSRRLAEDAGEHAERVGPRDASWAAPAGCGVVGGAGDDMGGVAVAAAGQRDVEGVGGWCRADDGVGGVDGAALGGVDGAGVGEREVRGDVGGGQRERSPAAGRSTRSTTRPPSSRTAVTR